MGQVYWASLPDRLGRVTGQVGQVRQTYWVGRPGRAECRLTGRVDQAAPTADLLGG